MAEINRIFDFPYYQLKTYNLEKAFTTKYDGEWQSVSSQEFINQANAISRGLLRLGIKPNDKIAVISSTNRTEWNILDIGTLQIGAQNVPIYPTIAAEDYEYILNHSESKYCIVSDREILEKLNSIKEKVPSLKEVYSFRELEGVKSLKEIATLDEDQSNQHEVQSRMDAVSTEDLATLIYTSGTTGKPKAVMLSHNNIVSNVLGSE